MQSGFRGYISGRLVDGDRYPQHVQNLVIRDYAKRNDLNLKISAAEYGVTGCYMMLETILAGLESLEGIIFFSLDMVPQNVKKRAQVIQQILDSGAEIHAALEDITIRTVEDAERVEEILLLKGILPNCLKFQPN